MVVTRKKCCPNGVALITMTVSIFPFTIDSTTAYWADSGVHLVIAFYEDKARFNHIL
jgi:hypothetical protein